jgi:protein tyrosine kinase
MGTEDSVALAIPGLVDLVEIGDSHTLLRAREQAEDRVVAVRLLGCEAGDDRFRSAALALRALSQHPHVVTVHRSGSCADGRGYVLLELFQEGSLGEWVAADGRLPYTEVLEVTLKIAGALATAHRAGVVHGDLRAERILVSGAGEPQLSGLDVAVFRCVKAQVEGFSQLLVADDVRALGAMMFTLLTADAPSDAPPEVALGRCAVPPSLQALVSRCLGNPAARPASIQDLARAIQKVQAELGLSRTALWIDEIAADEAREALRDATAPPPPELAPELRPMAVVEDEPEPMVEQISASEPPPQADPAVATEPTQSEPESEPELHPAPPIAARARRSSRRRWKRWNRRRLLVAGLAALAAGGGAVALRLLNASAPVEPPVTPPAVLEDQLASNTVAVYGGFHTVTDETGQLSMIVPEEWHSLESSPWMMSDRVVGIQLAAILADQGERLSYERFSFERPGAVLAMSEALSRDHTVEQVLDELRIDDNRCVYAGRKPFDDNLYVGAIDSYTGCGAAGSMVEVLVAAPADRRRIVMLRITRLDPRDVTARNRLVETFTIHAS